ncbi:MAG: M24 family metallopeptidase [Burkholderiaceae bacterium]
MHRARDLSRYAVECIGASIEPGMTAADASELALRVLADLSAERSWHPVIVRFGEDTLRVFREPPSPSSVLAKNDIYFVDIGPVWDGHEGDAGDTFVVGGDPDMLACASAVRTLWNDVREAWRHGASGRELYAWAARQARASGWTLNLDIRGHRVSDFPHAIHHGGKLGDFDGSPQAGLWVLEMQIAHPERPFGAFFEELLSTDERSP